MKRSHVGLGVELLEDRCTPAVVPLPVLSLAAGGVVWGGEGTTAPGIGLMTQDAQGNVAPASASPFAILQASQDAADGTFQNAYDGAFALSVNGTIFQNNHAGAVDLTGTTLTAATQTIAGLNTTVQYYFDPNSPTVRALYSFTNSTTADISAAVRWGNNIGTAAGDTPLLVTSSNGNNVLEATDRWFITRTGSASGLYLDWTRFGPGSVRATPTVTNIPGQGTDPSLFTDRYDITVAAGQTVRLMVFGQVSSTRGDATARTSTFDSTTSLQNAGLLSGLTAQQLSEIVNWDLSPAPAITSAATAAFAIGHPNEFTITTTGSPAPLLTLTGNLPGGISFVDHENGTATISGTPTFFENGTYPVTITAQNGSGPSATQTFTLTVPVISSPRFVVFGADAGGGPHVKVINLDGSIRLSFFAYDPAFAGGVRVASGDVNGDGVPDIITAPGAGGGGHVKVFDGSNGALLDDFVPYEGFPGGIFVAAGDVNGDGKADIITGADSGGGPHVMVFSGADLSVLASFFAFDPSFTGGVRVAAGDVNGDGRDDIITGAGPGSQPTVTVFDALTLDKLQNFLAYAPTYRGGVFVAAGDTNGDGIDEVITGPESSTRSVKIFNGTSLAPPARFLAASAASGVTRVGAVDFNGDGKADVLYGAGPGSTVAGVVDGATLQALDTFFTYDHAFRGGVFVAGSRALHGPAAAAA